MREVLKLLLIQLCIHNRSRRTAAT